MSILDGKKSELKRKVQLLSRLHLLTESKFDMMLETRKRLICAKDEDEVVRVPEYVCVMDKA